MANVIVAYILWLTGGVWGLHHFYLNRDRQAFTWFCTLGGCFGAGWLRDIFRIPDYVDDANNDPEYTAQLKREIQYSVTPPFSTVRFMGELVLGMLFGFLLKTAVPEDLDTNLYGFQLLDLIVPFGVAIGVHTVSNIGRERGSMKVACMGAYITIPLYIYESSNITYTAVASAIAVNNNGKQWRLKKPKPKSVIRRSGILFLCGIFYSSLWASALLNNAYVITDYGEKVKLKDAVQNFFNSPAWEETKKTLDQLWIRFTEQGFWTMWDELIISIDPEGESHSYRVLGLTSRASEKEVTAAYRNLVKQWHPDKIKDPSMKKDAEKRFIEIQKAYETLSQIKAKRMKQNKRH